MKRWLAVMFLLLALAGCSGAAKPYEAEFFAMDTVMQLRIQCADDPQALAREMVADIGALERLLSVTDDASEVARLNAGQAIRPSPALRTLLDATLALRERTGGCLDPSIYPIVKLWGFTTGQWHVPDEAERMQALTHCGPAQLSDDGSTLQLSEGAALDFGAVAKGYAAERCARLAERAGACAIVTLGGNVQTIGHKPDGTSWRVGITDPAQPEQSLGILSLDGSYAIVTSGGYQRYFERDGIRYSHIMDPRTGAPACGGLASVTIVAESGLLADGLSTALYVMGAERAEAFWREADDFEAVLITDEGRILVTQALAGMFSSDRAFEVIER